MFGWPIQQVSVYHKALISSLKMSLPLLAAPVPTVLHINTLDFLPTLTLLLLRKVSLWV